MESFKAAVMLSGMKEQSGVDPNILQRLADPSLPNVVYHMTAPSTMPGMMSGAVEQMGVDPSEWSRRPPSAMSATPSL
eukprot:6723496-Alexandrium_andersonii.AAC.1